MKTLAIIGTGISGMSAGYFLRDKFDITFYEKEDYAGGHTNTLAIQEGDGEIYIDSAFMVYNEPTYPLLTRLFKELHIETKPTSMSFSVQHAPSGLEYCSNGYNGLFAQRRNIFKRPYIKMLLEIDRFRREADEVLDDPQYTDWPLDGYIKAKGYSDDFMQKFLVPMSSAVWSTPAGTMLGFPARTLVRFFNHRFLSLDGQLAWRTCVDGSRQYRDKIMASFAGRVWVKRGAAQVKREAGQVKITDVTGKTLAFDKAVIACHADEALGLLADPSSEEVSLLGKFPYVANKATLHTDEAVMPKLKRVWSSWNYRLENDAPLPKATTIYWMNSLQGVSKVKNYFISINDCGLVDPQKILWERNYAHPLYTVEGQEAQGQLPQLNQNGVTFFCGAYFRYGFHEDGLRSGLDAARAVAGARGMAMKSCLYECAIMHERRTPKPYRFVHKVFMFYVDLDEWGQLTQVSWLLGHNQARIYNFRDQDHIATGSLSVKDNIRAYLKTQGVGPRVQRIQLLTNLRTFGYIFNPVAFYFCFGPDDAPVCVVCEIGNTFGELKYFYLGPDKKTPKAFNDRQVKYYYISPFTDLDNQLDFRIQVPDERLNIAIDTLKNGEKFFWSSMTGPRKALTTANLLWYTVKYPFVTLKVIFLIHWHAAMLHFFKKLPHRAKEADPQSQKEVHRAWVKK